MSWLCKGRLTAILFSILVWSGCGDVYRPVAIPIVPSPPDPKSAHLVFVLAQNGPFNSGSSTQIDVSGDTDGGQARVGLGPVHAAILPNGARIYVANNDTNNNNLDDTISSYSSSNFTSVTSITLPVGSAPVFVHTTTNDTVYVANSGSGTVAAISAASNVVTNTIPSDPTLAIPNATARPVALAETPNGTKLYVANQGTDSVGSINPVDKSVNPVITDPSISSPVWAAARSDSARAYVLSQGNGNLAVINTFTDALIPNSISAGAGANFMFYDKRLTRLYITNPTNGTVTILDVSADVPVVLATLSLAAAPGSACTSPVIPVSVTSLPDGSRAYAASYQLDGSTICSQVSVIDNLSSTVTKEIPLQSVTVDALNPTGCSSARFRLSIAAAADSSRVYVASCDAGNTTILKTFDNMPVLNLPAPVSAFPPPQSGQQPPRQNPVFVLPGS